MQSTAVTAAENRVRRFDVSFETDEAFTPAIDASAKFRIPALREFFNGTAIIRCWRGSTPNAWFLTDLSEHILETNKAVRDILKQAAETIGEVFAESTNKVEYPASVKAYASRLPGACEDEGKPVWTNYRFSAIKEEQVHHRWEAAQYCAESFNSHFGKASNDERPLSDRARAVLALGRDSTDFTGVSQLWLFRSTAAPIFELVKAGMGTVRPEGYFEMNSAGHGKAARLHQSLGARVNWVKPYQSKVKGPALYQYPTVGD
jgi:hypothetical protein